MDLYQVNTAVTSDPGVGLLNAPALIAPTREVNEW